jgi:hypothetical protein
VPLFLHVTSEVASSVDQHSNTMADPSHAFPQVATIQATPQHGMGQQQKVPGAADVEA